jgi:DNA-binding MarR family transcriptional regulator
VQVLPTSQTQRFLKGFWMLRQRLFRDVGGKLRDKHGVEFGHMQVLRYIAQHQATPTELSEAMQIPAHGISRMLEALETQGLLERKLNPTDARKRVLTITKKGELVLKKSHAIIDNELKGMLSVLSPKDLEVFIKHLETLTKEPV